MIKFFILLLFNVTFLYAQEKIEYLKEVVLIGNNIPKHSFKIVLKGKKYFTHSTAPNMSIISNHFQRKENQLIGVKFTLDASDLDDKENLFIRLLIMTEDKQEIFNSAKKFPLNKNTKEIIFSFQESFLLREETKYFIGFEIFDQKNTMKRIKFRGVNNKKSETFIKLTAGNWEKIDAPYSLDYELYLEN